MKVKERNIWRELELGFGGGSKFRVLLQLVINPKKAFTRYALVKSTGLRTPSVESQLKILLELGWVKEYHFAPKTYQIDLDNEFVRDISGLFAKMKYSGR